MSQRDRAARLLMLEPVALGRLLKSLRSQTGQKPVEVAEAIGIAPITLSRWERGAQRAPEALLEGLLSHLEHAGAELVEPAAPSDDYLFPTLGVVQREEAAEATAPLQRLLPPRAYAVAYEYLERMRKAGASREQIATANELFRDHRYAVLNAPERDLHTEDGWVGKIHDDWDLLQWLMRKQGLKL